MSYLFLIYILYEKGQLFQTKLNFKLNIVLKINLLYILNAK